jgi:hypothetical protein
MAHSSARLRPSSGTGAGRPSQRRHSAWDSGPTSISARQRPARVTAGCRRVRGSLVLGHQHLGALPEYAVSQVEQAGQRLAGAGLGIAADELVTVLEHEEPPAGQVGIVVAHHQRHQVTGIEEEPVGVEHQLERAPRTPFIGDRPQRRRLSGTGRPVQQQQLAGQGTGPHGHQVIERGRSTGAVIAADARPWGHRHPALVAYRAFPAKMPQAN